MDGGWSMIRGSGVDNAEMQRRGERGERGRSKVRESIFLKNAFIIKEVCEKNKEKQTKNNGIKYYNPYTLINRET